MLQESGDVRSDHSAGEEQEKESHDEFSCTVRVPMATFLKHVPLGHLEARGIAHLAESTHHTSKTSMKNGWNDVVKECLKDQYPELPCKDTIQFTGGYLQAARAKRSDTKFWSTKAYCKKKKGQCLDFQITLYSYDPNNSHVDVEVKSVPDTRLLQGDFSAEWHTVTQAKWSKTQLEKLTEELAKDTALTVFYKYLTRREADPSLPLPGPIKTLTNIRSGMRRGDDKAPDEHEDFVKEKEAQQAFEVVDYDTPSLFQYAWASNKQMELLRNQAKNGTAYLDSTGGFIHNAPPARQEELPRSVFYSALVVKPLPGKHSVPVSQMMSTSLNAVVFGMWLQWLRWRWNTKWSGAGRLFKTVVMDDSWALIHAVLLSLNHENIKVYLDRCYQEETRHEAQETTQIFDWTVWTVIHICAYHCLRRVRSYVSRRSKNNVVRKMAVNAYRALLRTDSLAEAEKMVTLIAIVFGRKHASEEVDRAVKELEGVQAKHVRRLREARGETVEEEEALEDDPDDMLPEVGGNTPTERPEAEGNPVKSKSLYKSSPYYMRLHPIIASETAGNESTKGPRNLYFIRGYLRYLEVEHLAYLPLLNRSFVREEANETTHLLTNNYVEKWFGTMKTDLFRKEHNIRRGEVLRRHGPFVDGSIISLGLPLARKPRQGARPPTQVQTKPRKAPASAAAQRGRGKGRGQGRQAQEERFLTSVADPSQEADQWGGVRQHPILVEEQPSTSSVQPSSSSALREANNSPWVMDRKIEAVPPHILAGHKRGQEEKENNPIVSPNWGQKETGNHPLPEVSFEEPTEEELIERFRRELERPPIHMTLSSEEEAEYKAEAKDLLKIIRRDECRRHLVRILIGQTQSARHDYFIQTNMGQDFSLGPFTVFPEMAAEFQQILYNWFPKCPPNCMHGVLIPEAILYAYRVKKECTVEEAEDFYSKSSQIVARADSLIV